MPRVPFLQAHEEVTPEVAKIADQILAEYGEEVIKKKKRKVKKQQIPNMKEDMKNLKVKTRLLGVRAYCEQCVGPATTSPRLQEVTRTRHVAKRPAATPPTLVNILTAPSSSFLLSHCLPGFKRKTLRDG